MKTVMVSGHFDPFHFAHLEYIKGACAYGDYSICVVANDRQAIAKKGKVNQPAEYRVKILDLILKGLDFPHWVTINRWDVETTTVAEALKEIKPDIFCRGSDKTLDDMPSDEKQVCDELGIEIVHIKGEIVHGSQFV